MGIDTAFPTTTRTLLPELAKLPGHMLWRAHARVTVLLAEQVPPGVDVHAYAVLLALAGGQPRSQQGLAEAVAVSRTTMVRVAADLAEQGLVERVRNPEDRRSYALTRTRAGAAAARRWAKHVTALEDAVARPFTPDERGELRSLLLALVRDDLASDAPEPLLDSIGFLVTRVHFRMHREFMTALAPLRIEPRHVGALTALSATGPVPQATLARNLGVSGPSVVQMVDDLEHRGLVERRRPANDRRSQVLHLLPGSETVLEQARSVAADSLEVRLAPLSEAETARLVSLLVRLVTRA